jgi:hypothetical protein
VTVKNAILLAGAALLVLVVVPGAFVAGGFLVEPIRKAGIDISENFRGGSLIRAFPDPESDLLRALPSGLDSPENRRRLDLAGFQVKKVTISAISGTGIESRMNLVFVFAGQVANPADADVRFDIPAMHVYIKAPGQKSAAATSNRVADAVFETPREVSGNPWDYQVILDGFHPQARIFDTAGRQVGKGLNVFVDEKKSQDGRIASTEIVAAIPLGLTGDPAVGAWTYYVAVGMADVRAPGMMDPAVYDTVRDESSAAMPSVKDGRAVLYPLAVAGSPERRP